MPITIQARKKMRHDRVLSSHNAVKRKKLRDAIKTVRKSPSKKTYGQAVKLLDKAAKVHLIHKNKAARLKSRLAKLIA